MSRGVAGETVPWHGRPGGGAAYLLPKSVTEHLADGRITELDDEPPGTGTMSAAPPTS